MPNEKYIPNSHGSLQFYGKTLQANSLVLWLSEMAYLAWVAVFQAHLMIYGNCAETITVWFK